MASSKIIGFGFIVLFLGIVGVRLGMENAAMHSPEVKHYLSTQKTYRTQMRVVDDPVTISFRSEVVVKDAFLDRRVLLVSNSQSQSIIASLNVGDVIHVRGFLSELTPRQRYRTYEHIVGIFSVEKIDGLSSQESIIDNASQKFRSMISRGCSRLTYNERGVCEGLLMGEKSGISKELYGQYRDAQLTHILVASGANIAFLVGFISPLLAQRSLTTRSIVIVIFSLFYCCATRFDPSILRACAMVVIPACTTIRGRSLSSVKVFIATATTCIIIDPFLVYRVGFWLSLCASGGLMFVAPILSRTINNSAVANTLAATLCVCPVLWIVFGFSLPITWWASVCAVLLAEFLSTFGMVIVCLTSFLPRDFMAASWFLFPVHIGVRSLNILANFATGPMSPAFSWIITGGTVVAYTCRRIVQIRYVRTSNGCSSRVCSGRRRHDARK